jgi:hypothetical protein
MATVLVSGQGFSFIDKHDGDLIPDLIEELALLAGQPLLILGEAHLPFAFRAYQDIEQFGVDRHANLLYTIG